MTLGEKVKFRRMYLRISQPELSRQIGVTQSYVSKIENDKHAPTSTVLAELARALKCTADYLICDEKKRNDNLMKS